MITKVKPAYNPAEIESKWQKKWEEDGLYYSKIDQSKPKHYAVTMLPYPSVTFILVIGMP